VILFILLSCCSQNGIEFNSVKLKVYICHVLALGKCKSQTKCKQRVISCL